MNQLVIKGQSGREVTTSQIVAQVFGKNHADVLRDVRELHCSKEFHECNFALLVEMRELPQGGKTKAQWYEMTKDGFSFLAMGYTGAKAGEFKEDFIREFNNREMMLRDDDYILARSQEILQGRLQAAERKLQIAAEEAAKAETIIEEQYAQLEEMDAELDSLKPKADYAEKVLASRSTLNITQIAAEIGMSAITLNKGLASMGIQRKVGGQWVLTSRHLNRGYESVQTTYLPNGQTKNSTVWTQKGRAFILLLTQAVRIDKQDFRKAVSSVERLVAQMTDAQLEEVQYEAAPRQCSHPDIF